MVLGRASDQTAAENAIVSVYKPLNHGVHDVERHHFHYFRQNLSSIVPVVAYITRELGIFTLLF